MQCKDVESVLEQEGLAPLSGAAREHLAECISCQEYIADLNAIVSAAQELPAEVEPPARVWISLRAQLEAEGIIKSAESVGPERASWWQSWSDLFRSRALAAAAVGCLIFAAATLEVRRGDLTVTPKSPTATTVASDNPQKTTPSAPMPAHLKATHTALSETSKSLEQDEHDLTNMQLADTASGRNSPVDTSLRDNLKQIDAFIKDCEQHLKDNPDDELAREYLSSAYRQKAELLSALLDRGRSVN